MLRKRFAFLAATAGLTAAALVTAPAIPASAHARHAGKATGHVALSGPIQYMKFKAFPRRHNHGSVSYTNFTYQASNTHVWNIGATTLPATDSLVFTLGTSTYSHTMTTTAVTPLSTNATMFTGTGVYNGSGNITWTVKGVVRGNHIAFTIKYNPPNAGYKVHARGVIAPDGAVSGTARDSNGKTLGFTMPAGSAIQVLHYHARVAFAKVWDHSARFGYKIPKSAPAGLAGLRIVVKVHDGGRGYKHDSIRFGVNRPTTKYTITSGNIRVRH